MQQQHVLRTKTYRQIKLWKETSQILIEARKNSIRIRTPSYRFEIVENSPATVCAKRGGGANRKLTSHIYFFVVAGTGVRTMKSPDCAAPVIFFFDTHWQFPRNKKRRKKFVTFSKEFLTNPFEVGPMFWRRRGGW